MAARYPNVSSRRTGPLTTFAQSSGPLVQRTCACGGECEECRKKDDEQARVMRRSDGARAGRIAPPVVSDVVRSSGHPLDPATRASMEPRFGRDFSRVRVHDDATASASARAVDATAYTVGSHIAFRSGAYEPRTPAGRHLIAHELAHVVQQRGAASAAVPDRLPVDASSSPAEHEAERIGAGAMSAITPAAGPMVSRANPPVVDAVMRLGSTPNTGLQFFPVHVIDTQVGPVSILGGRRNPRASRLHVIIGENISPRVLARQLLPLYSTATPFTPPGAAAPLPLDVITDEILAQALLVYNQWYLRSLPTMPEWRAGLRLPLPIEIDDSTGMATLNPTRCREMAAGFDPAWAAALDTRAPATAAPPAADLQAEVGAFHLEHPGARARGGQLAVRSVTNAVAARPFVHESFAQLGVTTSFDVALGFTEALVDREVLLLAAQRDGVAILDDIRTALSTPPATPSVEQQTRLTRANTLIGMTTGSVGEAPPGAARSRPEKSVTVDTVKLAGSTHDPATDVALASGIFAQCNVRLAHGIDATATPAQTTTWLRGDTTLSTSPTCGSAHLEERTMLREATTAFGIGARIRAFFVERFIGQAAFAYSVPPFCATGSASAFRGVAVVQNVAVPDDLGHEIGHILLNSQAHPAGTLMAAAAGPLRLTDTQCATIHRNA